MEFRVGSIADLISGTNTPNKKKVVKKIVAAPVVKAEPEASLDSIEESVEKIKKPKKSKKKNNETSESTSTGEKRKKTKTKAEIPDTKKSQTNKKRKLDKSEADLVDSDGEDSTPKKTKLSKNEQNAAGRIKNKQNQEVKNSSEYKDKTLFVGNIPINIKKEKVKKLFRKYGIIDSVRIRGIPVADPKTPKKVAAIKKEFHPDRNTVYAFIRFQNADDCKKAEAENGELFHENHLRVHCCESEDTPDETKAIFVGNLPFNAEDEELWNLFKPCGAIAHVRIVRDGRTGMGKGFAYVNFKDSDAVQLALEMEKVSLKDRELRISLCDNMRAKRKKVGKKPRNRVRYPKEGENGEEAPKRRRYFKKEYNDKSNGFSGTKFNDKNKKNKFNKGSLEKKTLAKKLAAPKSQKN
ncbi:unnamed protein product [Ceutorhynchus assimilis]|uniref:RRM domain-containing protein n=1 Tax=Ceutorhynchus assimilis TaxID=467358 RepID=A0A9N9MMV2_9CUCU|nr:unnamed protein product [Ceutorhynchus assimilis]